MARGRGRGDAGGEQAQLSFVASLIALPESRGEDDAEAEAMAAVQAASALAVTVESAAGTRQAAAAIVSAATITMPTHPAEPEPLLPVQGRGRAIKIAPIGPTELGESPNGTGAAAERTSAQPGGSEPSSPVKPEPPKPEEPRIFAVGDLVRAARLTLESRFADVRVEGEIRGLKKSGPGHLYFCLKDSEAQIECVMFSREAGRLKWKVTEGQQVRCRGRLTIFEGRGRFQMTIVAMEPAGAGLLALAFEELKQRLAAEGLFAPARKRALPFLPRRIGIVTSPHGAVIQDIVRVAHRRFPISLLLAPTPVQGEAAAMSIIAALRLVAKVPDVDLVILARGGGSMEDLWCFNDVGLARAIAACRVPVISAVGPVSDVTIADFVADVRAPTPSAAAELAVPMRTDLQAELAVLRKRIARATTAEISARRLVIERARRRVGDPRRLVDSRRQALDDLLARGAVALRAAIARRHRARATMEAGLLRAHPQRRIAEQRAQLAALAARLATGATARMASRRRGLEGLQGKLESLSPLSVLERGYTLTRRADGHVVTGAAGLKVGDAIAVRFRDGEVGAEVVATIEPAEAQTAPTEPKEASVVTTGKAQS